MFMSNLTHIVMGNCPSLAAVYLQKEHASVLITLDGLIIGFKYF